MVEVVQLSRGGTLIITPSGTLQVGAPPETIKDTIKILGEVPDTFVLPSRMFNSERGVSLADIEFPAYYNFFLKRRQIKLIGREHQIETIFRVLREAVLGPDCIQLVKEYPYGVNKELIPNLRAEMEFLRPFSVSGRRKAELNDMAMGIPWGPSNRVPFGSIALEKNKDILRVVDGKKVLAEVPLEVSFGQEPYKTMSDKPFEPPLFGVTVIGSGSGFDPEEMTSGFIIWINRRGILVDPPVDSTYWLKAKNINPRLIDDCILTHCHADHDSGLLQKLLEEKKINLHTTETIMDSFVRKYLSLTGLNYKSFMNILHFHPVNLQVPVRIKEGEFRFFYTLHSIPTIGFVVYFQGKSFVYSSDSLYDTKTFNQLYQRGDINRYRLIELTNFPWHHSVVFHEAGRPPLHTPIRNLEELPDPVKKNIYLIHVTQSQIPKSSLLRKAPDGCNKTIEISVSPPDSSEALEYLNVLNHVDLFSDLPIEKAREFLTLVKPKKISKDTVIVKEGSVTERFYMIVSGKAQAKIGDKVSRKYTENDYIGETSMILNSPRKTTITATTDMKVLVMDKYDFLYFIRGSEIARQMKIIAQNRENGALDLFNDIDLLKSLSVNQKTRLQGIMTRIELDENEIIAAQGTTRENFFVVDSGTINIERNNKTIITASRGSFIARVYAIPRRGTHRFSMITAQKSVVYAINVMDFYKFLEKNPGVFMTFREARMKHTIK